MSAPFPLPYRTAPDSLEAIRAEFAALIGAPAEPDEPAPVRSVDQVGNSDAVAKHPDEIRLAPAEPDTAAEARRIHLRRALERAADLGAAMLDALCEPQLDALDAAIVALDALDGDPDLEDGLEEDADSLEIYGEGDLHEDAEDGGDREPSLAAPERHPLAPDAMWRRLPHDGQVRRTLAGGHGIWMLGACTDAEQDHDGSEPEAGYDLPEGDGTALVESDDDGLSRGEGDDADDEPSLGSLHHVDQRRWSAGGSRDAEQVNEDGGDAEDEQWPWRFQQPDALQIAAEACNA